jgi:hypothetical protein
LFLTKLAKKRESEQETTPVLLSLALISFFWYLKSRKGNG